MRMLWGIICLVLLVVPAYARPTPPPPSDFQGDIYVDSRGCVFNRDDHKWVERKLDGQQICGFPPSLAPLRQDVAEDAPRPPNMTMVEQDLLGALASEIRQGELTADSRNPEPISEAPPAHGQDKFTAELTAMMRRDSELQASLSGSFRADDVCKRLGYRAELDPRPVLGWDVTMGLCPGVRATTPQEKIAFGQRLKDALAESQKVSAADGTAAADVVTSSDPEEEKSKEVASLQNSAPSKAPAEPETPKTDVILKPAQKPLGSPSVALKDPNDAGSAVKQRNAADTRKYVEVGIYRDDQSAEQAIRKLTKMGYPAAQAYRRQDRQTIRIIYAGPFNDQSGLNAALNMLHGAGYVNAVIR